MDLPDPIRDFVLQELSISPLISYQLLTRLRKHFPDHAQADLRDGLARVLRDLEKARIVENETCIDTKKQVVGGHYFLRVRKTETFGRVKLNGPTEPVLINGREYPKLTAAQYAVVEVLLDAGEQGLATDKLKEQSGHGDAVKILKRLSQKDGWNHVIHLPGTPGNHYRIF